MQHLKLEPPNTRSRTLIPLVTRSFQLARVHKAGCPCQPPQPALGECSREGWVQSFTRSQESLAGCQPHNSRKAFPTLHGGTQKDISVITQVFLIRRDGAIQFLSNCERAEPTGRDDKKPPTKQKKYHANQPTIQNKSKITFLHQGLNAILGAKEKC